MRYVTAIFLLTITLIIGCSGNDQKKTATSKAPPVSAMSQPMVQQQPAPASGFQSISPAAAQQLIDSRKDLMIIDVRSPEELQQGAIANSTLIPFWQILRGQHTLPKDKPLLLVCAVGGRSYAVAQVLQHQGYGELYNLNGGIAAWKEAGLPLQY